jgi:hypothetical protein
MPTWARIRYSALIIALAGLATIWYFGSFARAAATVATGGGTGSGGFEWG